ncbi:hypothetical protein JR316_0007199 [Psilocybe cubensis]|uniref:C3H1-type domain-containing protein n=2 Tax=Psilocybe cubensis TaxID=181762 RepID=A0A8H8CGD3_PSICU|nr:hypothetical protein JR316_0007199 [Psilocybe cubensis]KAH9480599.1 hypothetical protein JR316_0007199 [Psilocybe cubensis]
MSRKSQSQKKRHTKPCKFFQYNKCPHTADVCDFAHVIVNPVISFPIDTNSAYCRYYYAGHCANGTLCRFRHGLEAPAVPFDPAAGTPDWSSSSIDATILKSPPVTATYASFAHSWPYSSMSPTISPPPVSPLGNSSFSFSARSRDSIDTVSTAISSSSLGSDEIVTDDPQYQEHHHSHQSQVRVADDSPVIHVPPFLPMPYINSAGGLTPTHGYDFTYNAMPDNIKANTPFKSRSSKSSLKNKSLKYKTKPCKFFPTERGCPNGNACTFIHDEPSPRVPTPPATKSASAKEDGEVRKNFVPIPWRVIGGGVRVGIQRNEDEDDPESDSDDAYYPPEPPLSKKPAPIKSDTTYRPRSNSIPSTPSITQVKVDHLFSAESPGGL